MCVPAPDGMMECAEREEAMGLRAVKGGLGSSSLCECLFPQQSKPMEQTPDGFRPKHVPIFLPVCVCVCMFMFLLLSLRESTSPFHEDLM